MARGLFSGFLVGTVLSGAALGTVSVLITPPVTAPPEATALDVPAGSEFDQSQEDREANLPAADQETPEVTGAPKVTPPEPDDLTSLQNADTAPAGQPTTAQPEDGMSAPEVGEDASGVEVESDSPVLPSPQAMAPAAPTGEEDLSISTEPAQPPVPDVDDSGAFDSPDATPDGSAAPQETPTPQTEPAPEAAPKSEAEPEARAPQAHTSDPARAVDETTARPDQGPEQAAQNEADTPVDGFPNDTEADDAGRQATFGNMAQGVTTGRLPSMADTPAPPEAEAEAAAATAPEEAEAVENAEAEDTRPPLQRFATEFDNPDGKPLMSIVLIDDGDSAVGLEALSGFPYPISFALDPGWPGAAEAARRYHEAGFETLAMAYLPPDASPADTEVAMQAQMASVPNAVAVFEAPDANLQSNRDASEQLARILSASGHGLVMYPQGLNTAQKLIAKEGVPSTTLFRDFDASGQDATVIRRFLDQAAFRATREEGGVIMVGRLRPDTISALLLWGLQDRASTVALAPVSAILRQD